MGNYWSSNIFPSRKESRDNKMLLLGLHAAGKTSLLYKLKTPGTEVSTSTPIGFNLETLKVKGQVFTSFDVGGRSGIRPLQRLIYPGVNGIIFVIDSNDPIRMYQARNELHTFLHEELLERVPLLVLCNKQDLPNALPPEKVVETLLLNRSSVGLINRPWKCAPCVITTGKGVRDGLAWLFDTIRNSKDKGLSPQTKQGDKSAPALKNVISTKHGNDPTVESKNATLTHFRPIQNGTECPFAKAARLWGGVLLPQTGDAFTLEDQAKANVGLLVDFTKQIQNGVALDGFCVELQCPPPKTPAELGEYLRRFLTALSDQDPQKEAIMRVKYIGNRGWRFRFANTDFFLTSFAPCYPPTSSRYAFGTGKTFVLFQPEISFMRHKLPPDTPVTNASGKMTIRDKTRVAFQKAGRGFYIPDTIHYPPAEHIVKPLVDDGSSVVTWWLPPSQ